VERAFRVVFSGIVETTSAIQEVADADGQRGVRIRTPHAWRLRAGESVCVDGICSTVQRVANGSFQVTYMPETLRRSTFGAIRPGDHVNLERSLTLGSLLGGHLVQGHVDAQARIQDIRREGKAKIYEFKIPRQYSRYIVEKGSVAIDGISLTVAAARPGRFAVSLLAYTLRHTTLGNKRLGQPVNIEVDVLAKYVESLLEGGRERLRK
jgi:riboflavin synthase